MYDVTLEIPKSALETTYRHVHHAHTLALLEKVRLSFMEHIGYPNEQLLSEGFFLVIASIDIRYKREIFEGRYRFTVEGISVQDKALLMSQRVINDRSKDCVVAKFDFRLVDGRLKRSVVLPAKLVGALSREV